MPAELFEAKRGIDDSQTNAVFATVDQRLVFDLAIQFLEVAPLIAPGFIAECAAQDDRDLQSCVAVRRHPLSRRGTQQTRRRAWLPDFQNHLLGAEAQPPPPQITGVAAGVVAERRRQDAERPAGRAWRLCSEPTG